MDLITNFSLIYAANFNLTLVRSHFLLIWEMLQLNSSETDKLYFDKIFEHPSEIFDIIKWRLLETKYLYNLFNTLRKYK